MALTSDEIAVATYFLTKYKYIDSKTRDNVKGEKQCYDLAFTVISFFILAALIVIYLEIQRQKPKGLRAWIYENMNWKQKFGLFLCIAVPPILVLAFSVNDNEKKLKIKLDKIDEHNMEYQRFYDSWDANKFQFHPDLQPHH
jgi:hypothetical protein